MAKPKPTWADYYAAVAARSQQQSAAAKPSPYAGAYNLGFEGGTEPGSSPVGAGTATASAQSPLLAKPIDWSDPYSVLAKGIDKIPWLGNELEKAGTEPESNAAKVIDLMSRFAYGSENVAKGTTNTITDPNTDKATGLLSPVDWWKGFSGKEKTLAHNIYEEHDVSNEGWLPFLRNTAQDIFTDPTTYVGVGLVGGIGRTAARVAKGATGAVKGAEKGAKIAEEAAVIGNEAAATGKAVEALTPAAKPQNFMETLFSGEAADRAAGATGSKEAAQAFDYTPAPAPKPAPKPIVYEGGTGTFLDYLHSGEAANKADIATSGEARTAAEQAAAEQARLEKIQNAPAEGPAKPIVTPQYLAAKVSHDAAEEVAKTVKQRAYSQATINEAPGMGFFREVTEQVPVDPTVHGPAATKTPKALPEEVKVEQTEAANAYAHLAENGDKDLEALKITDPEIRLMMTKVNERVYDNYTPHMQEVAIKGGGKRKIRVIRGHGEYVHMGRIREILADPAASVAAKDKATIQLATHIKAVKDFVESEVKDVAKQGGRKLNREAAVGGFYKRMYGATPKEAEAAAKTPVIKAESPFKDVPTMREIKRIEKMDPTEKAILLHHLETNLGITREQVTYLAQAHNLASYQSRLKKVLETVKTSEGMKDVAEGIRAGRVEIDDPGIQELMKIFNVKTLPNLARRIEQSAQKVETAAKKMAEKNAARADKTAEAEIPHILAGEDKADWITPQGRQAASMAQEAMDKARQPRVPKTQEIVDRALAGDKEALAEGRHALMDEAQVGMYARALNYALEQTVVKAQNLPFTIRKDGHIIKKSEQGKKGGEAVIQGVWNQHTQRNVLSRLFLDFKSQFNKAKAEGHFEVKPYHTTNEGRAALAYERIMPVMGKMDQDLRAQGIFPVSGLYNATKGKPTATVSLFDAFDSIAPSWVQKYMFQTLKRDVSPGDANFQSIIAPTQLMDAINVGVTGLTRPGFDMVKDMDGLRALVLDTLKDAKITHNGKIVPNNFAKVFPSSGEQASFIKPIMDALPELAQRAAKHEAEQKLYHHAQVVKGTQASLEKIAADTLHPQSTNTQRMALANNLGDVYKSVIKEEGLTPDVIPDVVHNTNAAVDKLGYTAAVRGEAREAEEYAKASTATKTEQRVDQVNASTREAQEANPQGDWLTWKESGIVGRTLQQFFTHFGNPNIRQIYNPGLNATKNIQHAYATELNTLHRVHGEAAIANVFEALKMGHIFTETDGKAVIAAQNDLRAAIMKVFSEEAGYSAIERSHLSGAEMNEMFSTFKIPDKFKFPETGPIHDHWKNIATDDILDTLHKLNTARMAGATRKLIGDSIMAEEKWASKVQKPGFVRYNPGKDSELAKYIDHENMYFHKDIAREMWVFDRMLQKTAGWSKFNDKKMVRYFDESFHLWKASVTIYRAGHHVRNFIGDSMFNYLAGMTNPAYYGKAIELQRAFRGGLTKDGDMLQALMRGETPDFGKISGANDHFVTTTIGGKKVSLTKAEVYKEAWDRGLLPDYKSAEDIHGGPAKGSFMRALADKGPVGARIAEPFGGGLHRKVTSFAEGREHNARLAQFIFELHKKSYKTKEEAFAKGSARTRKWHPDGSDLTPYERNVMARTMSFYSWMRKAIPLVLESSVTYPGRVMAMPKAMYNFSIANGLDPKSLGDPFPEDTRYPEFIKNGLLGPLLNINGGQWGINPGLPQTDVLGDWGNDPGSSFLGGLNPALKIPGEMTFGHPQGGVATEARTGIPKYDWSDYIDQQIPQSNYFTGAFDRSLTQPWQAVGGDRREPGERGNQGKAFINWLSGIGAMQMDKPSYQRIAKKEETQRRKDSR